jgi:hypothetical protein
MILKGETSVKITSFDSSSFARLSSPSSSLIWKKERISTNSTWFWGGKYTPYLVQSKNLNHILDLGVARLKHIGMNNKYKYY